MKGFTLIELLIVLAVAALVAGFALPSLGALVADARRAATVNALVASLNLARHASITGAQAVSVCASRDGVHCGKDWNDGWMTFVAPRGWRVQHPVAEQHLLEHAPAPRAPLAVASNRDRYTFRPHRLRATNGTVVVCDRTARIPARAIVIAPSGRIRTTGVVPPWAAEVCP